MSPSLICLSRTAACQAHTSLRRQLWPCGGMEVQYCAREITDQLWLIRDCDDTRRVSPFRPDGPEPLLRCRRFACGCALDGSEFPCYLVWLHRDGQSYVLLDTATTDTLVLDQSFFRPLGMQHFYDSFALVSQICVVGMLWYSSA